MQPFCAKPLRQLLRLTSMARTSAEKAELAHLRADRGRLIPPPNNPLGPRQPCLRAILLTGCPVA